MNHLYADFTTQIVAAYLSKHQVAVYDIPDLIKTIYDGLIKAGVAVETDPAPAELKPAVPVKKSVTPDYLICLEDGKKLKMLKRHLAATYGLTPDEYRAKWGLPRDYPMIAPHYAASRSAIAKEIGLGRKPALRAVA